MILAYTWIASALGWLGDTVERVLPARAQRLLLNSEGGIDSTLAWLIGIAVIGGVAALVVIPMITSTGHAANTATANAISSIP
jgi:hypothetical protein